MLDVETTRSIAKRYHNARIPKGMPRIFTTNRHADRHEPIFPRGRNAAEQEGIDSRVRILPTICDATPERMHAAHARS